MKAQLLIDLGRQGLYHVINNAKLFFTATFTLIILYMIRGELCVNIGCLLLVLNGIAAQLFRMNMEERIDKWKRKLR